MSRSATKRLVPKSKEMIKEALDIIENTEDDEAAIAFLKDTLEDDYPDLDLGKMDLHEAIGVLGKPEQKKSSNMVAIENLNKSLGDFIEFQERKLAKSQSKRKNKRKKRTNKKSNKK